MLSCRRLFCSLHKKAFFSSPNRSIKASRPQRQTQQHPIFRQQEPRLPEPIPETTNVVKDVLLYSSYADKRFFKYMTAFGVAQLIFWGQLAYFSHRIHTRQKQLREQAAIDGTKAPDYLPARNPKDQRWYLKYMYAYGNFSADHPGALAAVYMLIGTLIAIGTIVLSLHTVHQLVLLKGGERISITTFGVFGRVRTYPPIPLKNVSADVGRTIGHGYIPLKVKGRPLDFRLDRTGKFHNANLFDLTAGLQRRWRA